MKTLTAKFNNTDFIKIESFWKENKFKLNIPFIDTQHAYLIGLVLKLENLNQFPGDKNYADNIKLSIKEALEYAEHHFKAEEELIHYFEIDNRISHIEQHRHFEELISKLTQPNQEITFEVGQKIYEFLKKWLSSHILKEDMHYANLIRDKTGKLDDFFKEKSLEDLFFITEEQHNLYNYILKKENHSINSGQEDIIIEKIRDIWFRFKLKLDIPVIDIQHIWLIHLAFSFEKALHETTSKRNEDINFILAEAIRYVNEHFKTEEFLLDKFNYKDFSNHIKAHNGLIHIVLQKKNEIQNGDIRAANYLSITLKEWLFSHIAIEDKKFSKLIQLHKAETIRFTKELTENKIILITKEQLDLYRRINLI